MADFLKQLRNVNVARSTAWFGGDQPDALFDATEFAGEAGELCNVVKKLHRERMGYRGSTVGADDLANEIADVMICLDKLAAFYGIDIEEATRAKFNATSEKVGLNYWL